MQNITEYFSNLSEFGKVSLISETAKGLVLLHKRKDNALKREINTPTHSSRALRTTVYANSQKITEAYIKQEEFLKQIVKLL